MNDRPIACRLGAADLANVAERWLNLREQAGLARHETETGLRLDFKASDAVAGELRELVAIEGECCAWADWRVEPAGAELHVHITSAGGGIETAQSMFR
jgi:hypothetical protein